MVSLERMGIVRFTGSVVARHNGKVYPVEAELTGA